ncbi:MAG TPA: YqeG family HAD IIIA-type phosphatase, partial [Coriobacteriia bacterium]|nr:YqeG family HAD IIIA-type phosphatase [Coriobacteriia bacterium]
KAMRLLGSEPGACVMVGDQLFMDILGGRLAGMRTILVEPLTRVDLPHTRVLRRLEQRIMAGRSPEA